YFIEMGCGKEVSAETIIAFFKENRREEVVNDFIFSTVTSDEVKSTMNEIKSKAVGGFGISIDMIKAVSPYAIEAITHLINESLINEIFPENWKISLIRPLPKVAAPKCVEQFCVEDFDFDFLGISETWLTPDMSSDCYSLKGYSFCRFDRTCGPGLPSNGGGVAVYFRERFDMKRIYLDHIDGRLEYICVLGKVQILRLCVCVVYKLPSIPYSCFTSLFHALLTCPLKLMR
ncbi:Ganglioside-induced differentiation-associated protein 2, partial [Homalodisca vitripennis]